MLQTAFLDDNPPFDSTNRSRFTQDLSDLGLKFYRPIKIPSIYQNTLADSSSNTIFPNKTCAVGARPMGAPG